MVASGALPLEDAYKAVDLYTITLLLGMMIVVASLRLSGFFAVANAWVGAHARRPLILLGVIVATSGVFSAFLVNDAICLVLAPFRPRLSDYNRARDLEPEPGAAESQTGIAGYGILFKSRPLVIFGLCVMLFHLANTALLPLVGQKLAAAYPKEATAMMSACIVAAQAVMLPIALLVGRTADSWGRKPLFLAGFAILPIRAVLYTLSDNSFWLVGVQVLDGVGAGIFGALTPLVIADIMRGTGRYNLAQGAIATVQGIGASLSGLAAGVIVDHFGYSAAFLTLGAAAFVALVVFALRMPETADRETVSLQS
jgi:hypothetical protein